jgi:hypothetical protein
VLRLRRSVTTAVAVAALVGIAVDRAAAGGPDDPRFLFFTGTDVWRYGAFLYGGALWSPAGLDKSGFTFKTLLNGGGYTYTSGTLNADIKGTTVSAAVLPGWKFIADNLIVSVFAGPVVQDYRLSPYDPGSHLHGLYAGGQFGADLWFQPTPASMISINGTVASIGPTGSLRVTVGARLFDRMFVGPENQEIWCGDFEEYQFGAHVTALHTDKLEWSAGSGWGVTSDHRNGPYLRVGVNTRY